MTTWNPDLYLKYADERTRPSYDLVARIDLPNPARIVDIGCGPGNSTQVLRQAWPHADILGLDSSPQMIDKARAAYPDERWTVADAAAWATVQRYDLVFSNAALQWMPDHDALIPALFERVAPGGALAVQVPFNRESPLQQAIAEVADRPRWRQATAGCEARLSYLPAGYYYDRLAPMAARLDLWQTVYYHVLAGHQDMIDWSSSTSMRPYLERLADDAESEAFRREVRETCAPQYPTQADGKVLFPFKRTFFIAYKA
jgi:trans-aconitate 2-methyltransferase